MFSGQYWYTNTEESPRRIHHFKINPPLDYENENSFKYDRSLGLSLLIQG